MALILSLESSCDETAIALVRHEQKKIELISSLITSQIPLHERYGGVIPELASRNHTLAIRALLETMLKESKLTLHALNAIAATIGPGLASSLLIGSTVAKSIAIALDLPFIGINHMEGHLVSPFIARAEIPEHLALIISGGHTLLIHVHEFGKYKLVGETLDDACGEAFDKVGKMLGLPYPGGPHIEQIALQGSPTRYTFPRSMMHDEHFNFSFSGLKTAVLYTLQKEDSISKADVAASFQAAIIDVLIQKTLKAAKKLNLKHIALSGGVSMNQAIRDSFQVACVQASLELSIVEPKYATDNAAMIGFAGCLHFQNNNFTALNDDIFPKLPLIPIV